MYPSGDILARFASIGPPVVVVFRKRGVVMNGWERRFQSGERASKGNYAVGVETMNYLRVRAAFARDQRSVLVDYVTSKLTLVYQDNVFRRLHANHRDKKVNSCCPKYELHSHFPTPTNRMIQQKKDCYSRNTTER